MYNIWLKIVHLLEQFDLEKCPLVVVIIRFLDHFFVCARSLRLHLLNNTFGDLCADGVGNTRNSRGCQTVVYQADLAKVVPEV